MLHPCSSFTRMCYFYAIAWSHKNAARHAIGRTMDPLKLKLPLIFFSHYIHHSDIRLHTKLHVNCFNSLKDMQLFVFSTLALISKKRFQPYLMSNITEFYSCLKSIKRRCAIQVVCVSYKWQNRWLVTYNQFSRPSKLVQSSTFRSHKWMRPHIESPAVHILHYQTLQNSSYWFSYTYILRLFFFSGVCFISLK
jgi:hypothetical protein